MGTDVERALREWRGLRQNDKKKGESQTEERLHSVTTTGKHNAAALSKQLLLFCFEFLLEGKMQGDTKKRGQIPKK